MASEEVKRIDISDMGLAKKWELREQAAAQVAELQAFINLVDDEVKKLAGDAEEILLFGSPVYTYKPRKAYRFREFTERYPMLANAFMVERTVLQLDKDALIDERAELLEEFRVREFRRVKAKGEG